MATGKNEAKIRFTAETSDFTKAVSEANQSLGNLSAELKLNSAQMKNSSDEAEKLTERKELLGKQLEAAENKTEALRKKMEAAANIYGENSTEVQKLQRQVALAAAAEESIRGEINKVNAELDKQAAESKEAKTAFSSLEKTISAQEDAMEELKRAYTEAALTYGRNSKEAKDLAKEIRSLGSELNDNKTKMNNAQSAADKLEEATQDAGEAAEEANDGFTIWKGTLADLASNAIQSAWSGITGLATSFWNLGDETRELRTNMNKVETAFETAGLTADDASETYENFYGILADEGQATEAVGHLAKLAQSQEDLSEWTDICTGIYATFGDSLPIEGLTEAANETIKTGAVTGTLADALNWSTMSSEEWQKAFEGHPKALKKFQSALKSGMNTEEAFNEALTQCTTESEREQVIRQALTGLYGDAAAAYAETSGSIIEANKAQANYNSALSGLGEIIEPIKTSFTNGMASMLESVTALFEGMDTEAIQAGIQTAFDYINDTVFPAIKTGIQWFLDNKDLVIAGVMAIVAGIAAFKIVSVVQSAIGVFKSFKAAQQGVTIAQQALNLVMSANPIGLVIALIVALVAGFIYLWNNCEWFREFWIGLWENIQYYAGIVVDALVNFFTVTLPAAWDTFKTTCSEVWNSIWATISTVAMNIWTSVSTWFNNTWTSVTTTVSGIWSSVTTWFSNIWSSLVGIVSNIWESVTSKFTEIKTSLSTTVAGIWTAVTTKFNAIKTTATTIWNTVKTTISTVWAAIKTTVSTAITTVKTKISTVFNSVKSTVTNIWDNIKAKISGVWDSIKSGVSSAVDNVRSTVARVFNAVKSTVTDIWNNIKSAIENPITKAKETISGVVDKIKDALNFEWSIPKPKLPHFTVSGGEAPWGFMGNGSLPKVSVSWYAKGAILEAPTLFGVGKNGNLMGGGEAGAEAVAPIDVLLGYVREAVSDVMGALTFTFEGTSSTDRLETYLNTSNNNMGRLIDAIEDLASRAINIDIDSMRVATATAGASDNVSGNRLNLKSRGLALK